ncbi:unnamed protein product [Closterium sp. NIES-54]
MLMMPLTPRHCPRHHCTALHCTALHCIALHCTALHCTALHCTARHCTALHCTALHCTALHCTALHCTARHCTALHCTALHCTASHCTALHTHMLTTLPAESQSTLDHVGTGAVWPLSVHGTDAAHVLNVTPRDDLSASMAGGDGGWERRAHRRDGQIGGTGRSEGSEAWQQGS